jgi:hypothetical protein
MSDINSASNFYEIPGIGTVDLESGDWMGMACFLPDVSVEEAFRLNEEYFQPIASNPRFWEAWRNRKKCEVEFVF